LLAGARNLFDTSYGLVDSHSEQGRSFFATLHAQYGRSNTGEIDGYAPRPRYRPRRIKQARDGGRASRSADVEAQIFEFEIIIDPVP
jgi:hypothetical protein